MLLINSPKIMTCDDKKDLTHNLKQTKWSYTLNDDDVSAAAFWTYCSLLLSPAYTKLA